MIEYYIAELAGGKMFKIAKFDGDAQPANVYFVTMKLVGPEKTPEMHCDCPNRRRGKHVNDKHGQMIARWIIQGKPAGFFDEKGVFHARDQVPANAASFSDPDDLSDVEPGDDDEEADGDPTG